MDWTPGGMSDDVEDRRGESGGGGGGGGGFGFGGGGGLGIGGFVLLVVISLITGHNYIGQFFSGGNSVQTQQAEPYQPRGAGDQPDGAIAQPSGPITQSADEKRSVQLISFTLDDAQKTWTQIFAQDGKQYRHAKLVLFRDETRSGCGDAQSTTGPFYCPQDEKVYIDLGFWDELRRLGGSTSDFAQAYVVTHEIGHHIQKLLGIEGAVERQMRAQPDQRSHLSVDLELQADCFAGVWAHSTEQRGIVHQEDIAAGLKAAAAVGDDHLQKMAGRSVSPENFTHGSSAQRQQWFERGLQNGTIDACNTFKTDDQGY